MSLNQLKNSGVEVPERCLGCRALACIDGQLGDLGRLGMLGADRTAFGKPALLGEGTSQEGVPDHVWNRLHDLAAIGLRRQARLVRLARGVIDLCGPDVEPPDVATREAYATDSLAVAGLTFVGCDSKHPAAPAEVCAATAAG